LDERAKLELVLETLVDELAHRRTNVLENVIAPKLAQIAEGDVL
jgi:hypothetical protein